MKYQDYLQVSVDKVKEAGFKKRYPKNKYGTTYYVSENCEYVLAYTRDEKPVILDKETYDIIGDKNIHMKYKEYHNPNISPIPRIISGNGKTLHRVVMGEPKGKQVDHINHNQSCCIKENLRPCNSRQNNMNQQKKCGISECDGSVDDYIAYRDSAKEQYKGTDMEEFVYNIENDFSETIGLLIHHYIIQDISKEQMYQMNLDYWRDKLDNASGLRVAI